MYRLVVINIAMQGTLLLTGSSSSSTIVPLYSFGTFMDMADKCSESREARETSGSWVAATVLCHNASFFPLSSYFLLIHARLPFI